MLIHAHMQASSKDSEATLDIDILEEEERVGVGVKGGIRFQKGEWVTYSQLPWQANSC